MPKPINDVHFGGHAGKDAEQFGNGPIKFSIAVGGGEYKGKTYPVEWINCEAWNQPELGSVEKGQWVEVWGRIRTNSWVDKKTNEKKYQQVCTVTKYAFIDPPEQPLPSDDYDPRERIARDIANGITDDDIPF